MQAKRQGSRSRRGEAMDLVFGVAVFFVAIIFGFKLMLQGRDAVPGLRKTDMRARREDGVLAASLRGLKNRDTGRQ